MVGQRVVLGIKTIPGFFLIPIPQPREPHTAQPQTAGSYCSVFAGSSRLRPLAQPEAGVFSDESTQKRAEFLVWK